MSYSMQAYVHDILPWFQTSYQASLRFCPWAKLIRLSMRAYVHDLCATALSVRRQGYSSFGAHA